jgi:hypothetical protein
MRADLARARCRVALDGGGEFTPIVDELADEDEETADEAFLGLHWAGWDRTDRQVGGGRLDRVPEGGRVG